MKKLKKNEEEKIEKEKNIIAREYEEKISKIESKKEEEILEKSKEIKSQKNKEWKENTEKIKKNLENSANEKSKIYAILIIIIMMIVTIIIGIIALIKAYEYLNGNAPLLLLIMGFISLIIGGSVYASWSKIKDYVQNKLFSYFYNNKLKEAGLS